MSNRKSKKKLKVTYKESSLPKKEKEKLLWKVFDLLFSQKNDASEKEKIIKDEKF